LKDRPGKDTEGDVEFTDWQALARAIEEFVNS
jgi:menaquinone-dependent protoporphyrinogen IX oxidase